MIWTIAPAVLRQLPFNSWIGVSSDVSYCEYLCWLLTSEDAEFRRKWIRPGWLGDHQYNMNLLSSKIFLYLFWFFSAPPDLFSAHVCALRGWPWRLHYWCSLALWIHVDLGVWEGRSEKGGEESGWGCSIFTPLPSFQTVVLVAVVFLWLNLDSSSFQVSVALYPSCASLGLEV